MRVLTDRLTLYQATALVLHTSFVYTEMIFPLTRKIFLICCLLTFAAQSYAQVAQGLPPQGVVVMTPPCMLQFATGAGPQPHGQTIEPESSRFNSPAAGFTIALPKCFGNGMPWTMKAPPSQTATYGWQFTGQVTISVGLVKLEKPNAKAPDEFERLAKLFHLHTRADVKLSPNILIVTRKEGLRRFEITDHTADGWGRTIHLYAVEDRAYFVLARYPAEVTESKQFAEQAVETLRIFTNKERAAAVAEKIKAADALAAEGLSQAAPLEKISSDAKRADLKGRVHSVITTAWRVDEGIAVGPRNRTESFYDTHGDLLRVVNYYGEFHPTSVVHYGDKNGERVERNASIRDHIDFGDNGDNGPHNVFERIWIYKYDALQRLIESSARQSGVSADIRTVNTYKPGEMHSTVYYLDGKVGLTRLYKYDSAGNIVTHTYAQAPRENVTTGNFKTVETSTYRSLDKKGNWTRRRFTRTSERKSNPPQTLTYDEIREIKYY